MNFSYSNSLPPVNPSTYQNYYGSYIAVFHGQILDSRPGDTFTLYRFGLGIYNDELKIEKYVNEQDPTDVIYGISITSGIYNEGTYTYCWATDPYLPVYASPLPYNAIPIDGTTITVNADGKLVAAGGSAPSNMVTTDTAQTITGYKTFELPINIQNASGSSQPGTLYLGRGSASSAKQAITGTLGSASNSKLDFILKATSTGNDISTLEYKKASLSVLANNETDLGTSSYKWKDLYLAGNLSDGTNTATIADLAALITYAKGQGWIQ